MAIQKIKRQKGTMYRVRLQMDGRRITKCFVRKHDAMEFPWSTVVPPTLLKLLTYGSQNPDFLVVAWKSLPFSARCSRA